MPGREELAADAPEFAPHSVDLLRQECQARSTRVFTARGYAMKRCRQCLLSLATCICGWRQPGRSNIEFVLLMHRDEVFKPTNTGRLVADLFPGQCHAFQWERTQPPAGLLALINDPARQCLLVFPPNDVDGRRVLALPAAGRQGAPSGARITTVILLDGTWKQARKMYTHSEWMKHLPVVDLATAISELDDALGHYRVRQACESGRLATAEAAALCLYAAGELANTRQLLNYFAVFNEHYIAARFNREPARLPAHDALAADDAMIAHEKQTGAGLGADYTAAIATTAQVDSL